MPYLPFSRRAFSLSLLSVAALPAFAQNAPSVAAVNYPLAYFAERLLGAGSQVIFPVPADTDPSFWRPGIADIAAMQAADVIALNGAGFASWTTKVSLPRSRLVNTSSGFEDQFIRTETITHSHGDGGSHSHTGTANYLWLDFSLATQQAEALAAMITRRLPDQASAVEQNLEALRADLAALGEAAQSAVAQDDVKAIASHPRYQYFARAYGMEIASLEWDAAAEVTEEQWQELSAEIAETGATLFIWEAAPSDAALARVRDMGLKSVVFPPLANRPEAGDFLSEMRTAIAALSGAITG